MSSKSFRELILESARKIDASSISVGSDAKAIKEAEAFGNEDYYERQKKDAEINALNQKNENSKQNRKLRRSYATCVMVYLCIYSLFVAVLLVLSGFQVCSFHLPDSVLEFLVGSTAASAIGLVLAVTHGLFKDLD